VQPVQPPPPPPQQPPPRLPLKPLTHRARTQTFGVFGFRATPTPGAPESISINREWLAANIVVLELPHLAPINGGVPVKARVHKLAAPRWLALFDAWRKAKLLGKILTYNGSFVARYKRGHAGGGLEDLSNHSWGTAIDLNAQWNRLGQRPAPVGAMGSLIELVPIANDLGFAWGGDFVSRPDGMHFECVRLG
jgi:hypothetical protein